MHGVKVDLHLERLWPHNVTITTRLVDTVSIPMLLKTVRSKRIDVKQLITHHFKLNQIPEGLRHVQQGRRHQGTEGDRRSVRRHPGA